MGVRGYSQRCNRSSQEDGHASGRWGSSGQQNQIAFGLSELGRSKCNRLKRREVSVVSSCPPPHNTVPLQAAKLTNKRCNYSRKVAVGTVKKYMVSYQTYKLPTQERVTPSKISLVDILFLNVLMNEYHTPKEGKKKVDTMGGLYAFSPDSMRQQCVIINYLSV